MSHTEGRPAGAARWWTRRSRVAPRQWIKIVVYSLLLVNFANYIVIDLELIQHTARPDWKWIDWTSAFATTLDESAWFILLLLLELETYLLDDSAFTRGRVRLMHAVRIICFLFIAHTVYAFADNVWDLYQLDSVPESSLCSFSDDDLSYAQNLSYTDVDAETCTQLTSDTELYLFQKGQLVTDAKGMRIEKELGWVDLLEVILWLVIVFNIELLVRLQERGVTSGGILRSALWVKGVAYAFLWCAALYWAWRGHWMFVWDEALWIFGFMAIGSNLSQWRREIEADV